MVHGTWSMSCKCSMTSFMIRGPFEILEPKVYQDPRRDGIRLWPIHPLLYGIDRYLPKQRVPRKQFSRPPQFLVCRYRLQERQRPESVPGRQAEGTQAGPLKRDPPPENPALHLRAELARLAAQMVFGEPHQHWLCRNVSEFRARHRRTILRFSRDPVECGRPDS